MKQDLELVQKINLLLESIHDIKEGPVGDKGEKGDKGDKGDRGDDAPVVDAGDVARVLLERTDFLEKVKGNDGQDADIARILHEYQSLPKEKKFSAKNFFKDNPFQYYQVSGSGYSSSQATSFKAWVATTTYDVGVLAVTPNGSIVSRSIAGVSGTSFDNTEAANWTISIPSPTPTAWTANTYQFAGEQFTANNGTFRRTTSGISGATFDATEIAGFTLVSGKPVTDVATTYTVVETDAILALDSSGGSFTVTIPASRTNNELHLHIVRDANDVTIQCSGAETIIDPLTYSPDTSIVVPGVVGLHTFIDLYRVGDIWQIS